jgi:hypothetical protein
MKASYKFTFLSGKLKKSNEEITVKHGENVNASLLF